MTSLAAAMVVATNAPLFSQESKSSKDDKTPKVIEIDISKLPPELAKQLLEFSQRESAKAVEPMKTQKGDNKNRKKAEMKGAPDAISLGEAVTLAEKAGKGKAISADRKDGLDYTHFTVQIVTSDGVRTQYTLSAKGVVLQQGKARDRDRD